MRRRRWWLPRAAGLAAVGLALLLLEISGRWIACGSLPARVEGTVADATTGAPVAGASVLTLSDPAIVRDPKRLAQRRRIAQLYEEQPTSDPGALVWAPVGSAHTGSDGVFGIVVGLSTSSQGGRSGIEWSRSRASPFAVVRALLVEKEGYAPLVYETKDARWRERPEGEIIGTLDVGTIGLTPIPAR